MLEYRLWRVISEKSQDHGPYAVSPQMRNIGKIP